MHSTRFRLFALLVGSLTLACGGRAPGANNNDSTSGANDDTDSEQVEDDEGDSGPGDGSSGGGATEPDGDPLVSDLLFVLEGAQLDGLSAVRSEQPTQLLGIAATGSLQPGVALLVPSPQAEGPRADCAVVAIGDRLHVVDAQLEEGSLPNLVALTGSLGGEVLELHLGYDAAVAGASQVVARLFDGSYRSVALGDGTVEAFPGEPLAACQDPQNGALLGWLAWTSSSGELAFVGSGGASPLGGFGDVRMLAQSGRGVFLDVDAQAFFFDANAQNLTDLGMDLSVYQEQSELQRIVGAAARGDVMLLAGLTSNDRVEVTRVAAGAAPRLLYAQPTLDPFPIAPTVRFAGNRAILGYTEFASQPAVAFDAEDGSMAVQLSSAADTVSAFGDRVVFNERVPLAPANRAVALGSDGSQLEEAADSFWVGIAEANAFLARGTLPDGTLAGASLELIDPHTGSVVRQLGEVPVAVDYLFVWPSPGPVHLATALVRGAGADATYRTGIFAVDRTRADSLIETIVDDTFRVPLVFD